MIENNLTWQYCSMTLQVSMYNIAPMKQLEFKLKLCTDMLLKLVIEFTLMEETWELRSYI
jgi:hypothetical protein